MFLPPYSPDPNPVEFIWKTIKREVSPGFIQSKEHLRNIIKNEFIRIEKSLSVQRSGQKNYSKIKSVISWENNYK